MLCNYFPSGHFAIKFSNFCYIEISVLGHWQVKTVDMKQYIWGLWGRVRLPSFLDPKSHFRKLQIESSLPTIRRIINNMIAQLRLCDMLTDLSKNGPKIQNRILRSPWIWLKKYLGVCYFWLLSSTHHCPRTGTHLSGLDLSESNPCPLFSFRPETR